MGDSMQQIYNQIATLPAIETKVATPMTAVGVAMLLMSAAAV